MTTRWKTAPGYHVVILKYPNDESASVCRQDADAASFEKFRMAFIAGGASEHLSLDRAESIENRLIKLLGYLRKNRPAEHWEQFLTADEAIHWPTIAVPANPRAAVTPRSSGSSTGSPA